MKKMTTGGAKLSVAARVGAGWAAARSGRGRPGELGRGSELSGWAGASREASRENGRVGRWLAGKVEWVVPLLAQRRFKKKKGFRNFRKVIKLNRAQRNSKQTLKN